MEARDIVNHTPSKACSEKRKVAKVKAGKMNKSVGPPASTEAEVTFEMERVDTGEAPKRFQQT